MNFLLLRKSKILYFLENTKSNNLGFYFSFFLHLLILLFAVGFPNFFETKTIFFPNVIPIEIINIAENTSISKDSKNIKSNKVKNVKVKKKKFNSSDNQQITNIEVKDKPSVKKNDLEKKIATKENLIVKEKKITPANLEKNIVRDDDIESLPSKKIIPKTKPKKNNVFEKEIEKKDFIAKTKPKPKSKPDFSISSMLRDLRNEQSNKKIDEIKEVEKDKDLLEQESEISDENSKLSISEIDLLRQQLSSCWNAPAGVKIEKGMNVKISAKIKQNRRIIDNSVRIIDTNISKSNPFYGPITESAMRTLLNPECIPLKLPEDKYTLWKDLTITFDYSIMKGY